MALLFPFTVVLLAPPAMLFHIMFNNKKTDDFFVQSWGVMVCGMFGVKVILEGKENIPDGGCLFLFNHSSFMDIFSLVKAIPGIRFGAKSELFKIPLFGAAITMMGTLKITRENREAVFKVYQEAKKQFALGHRYCLAPEGGRFYSSEGLSKFKSGPFIFAISAETEIVPTVILGANEVWPKKSLIANWDKWNRTIKIIVLPSISTKGLVVEKRQELQQQVYNQMNQVWVGYKEKL